MVQFLDLALAVEAQIVAPQQHRKRVSRPRNPIWISIGVVSGSDVVVSMFSVLGIGGAPFSRFELVVSV